MNSYVYIMNYNWEIGCKYHEMFRQIAITKFYSVMAIVLLYNHLLTIINKYCLYPVSKLTSNSPS